MGLRQTEQVVVIYLNDASKLCHSELLLLKIFYLFLSEDIRSVV